MIAYPAGYTASIKTTAFCAQPPAENKTLWMQTLGNGISAQPSPSLAVPGEIAMNLFSIPDLAVRGTALVTDTKKLLATDLFFHVTGTTAIFGTTNQNQGLEIFGARAPITISPGGVMLAVTQTQVTVTWGSDLMTSLQILVLGVGGTPLLVSPVTQDVTGNTLAIFTVTNAFNFPYTAKVIFDSEQFDGTEYVKDYP